MIEAAREFIDRATAEAIARCHVPLKQMDAEMALEYALADRDPSAAPPDFPLTDFLRALERGLT